TGAVTPSISITQPRAYSVQITDAILCSVVSDTVFVTVDNLSTNTLGHDVSICSGNRLELKHALSSATHQYTWSNGSNASFITPTNSNTYSVAVTNSNGCQLHDTIQITVAGSAPIVEFTTLKRCIG